MIAAREVGFNTPERFYKRRSQEKISPTAGIFLASQPTWSSENCSDLSRHVLRSLSIVAQRVWVFSNGGFHRLFATKPISSETSKAERWSHGDHSSIWDSWPIAFSGYPRGPRVGCETECPRHTAPNFSAETRSRTRVSREPDGHRQRRSPAWSGLGPRHSNCLWFQILGLEAHSFLPNQQRDRGNFPC